MRQSRVNSTLLAHTMRQSRVNSTLFERKVRQIRANSTLYGRMKRQSGGDSTKVVINYSPQTRCLPLHLPLGRRLSRLPPVLSPSAVQTAASLP